MTADPPVRTDGRCHVCLGPRKIKPKQRHGLEAQLDPFCSNVCCRAYHANPLPNRSIWELHHGAAHDDNETINRIMEGAK